MGVIESNDFFFDGTATTGINTGEDTLSLHDALPIFMMLQHLDAWEMPCIETFQELIIKQAA